MYRGSRSGGGPSSISLGWDEPAPAPRPRTRARTPPGGASSISLGWGNDTGYNPRAKTPPPSRYHDKENDAARSELPRQQAMGRQPRESSNSYACGSQQNVGNVITDKPTTRVRQNPGGASQFSLGWDDAKVPASRPARGAPWQSDIDSQRDADSDAGFLQSTIDSRQNHQSSDIFMMGRPATRGGANQGWDDYSSAPSAQSTAMLRNAQADFFARHRQNEARYSGDDRVSRMADFEGRADSEANPLEDSPRDQRGRSLHHLSKEEPRGVSLPDSDSEAEQGRMEGWGDTQHGPVTPGASSYATSIPAGHSRSDVAFGQRPREGANSFACGRQQNVGNYITERPTTRVAANPGGASSLRLGWDDEGSSSTPRQTNRTPRSAAIGSQSQPDHGIGPDMHGRRPSQDAEDQLKSLKARMAKKQQDSVSLLQLQHTFRPHTQPDGGETTKYGCPKVIFEKIPWMNTEAEKFMSWMLIGAFIAQLALVYVVNWPDEDIRWYSYETIGTAIDTFIGVLLFSSLNSCIEHHSSTSQYSEGATLALKVAHMAFWIVALQIVLGVFACATSSGKAEKHEIDQQTLDLKCSAGIMTHIAAFAVLQVGVAVQGSPWFSSSPVHALAVVPVGCFLLWLIFMITHTVRDAVISRDGKITHGEELWNEESQEGENDAFCFAISFLIVNALQFQLFGKLPHHEDLMVHIANNSRKVLFGDLLILLGGMFMLDSMVIVLVYMVGGLRDVHVRSVVIFLELLSMCSGWVTLAAAKVIAVYLYPEIDLQKVNVRTVLALALTGFTFFYVLVLDKLADKLIRGGRFHQALVKVILSQGLLVGFSWEQCFFAAEDGITDGPLQALACSLLLCASILPAYRYYILPNIVTASLVPASLVQATC